MQIEVIYRTGGAVADKWESEPSLRAEVKMKIAETMARVLRTKDPAFGSKRTMNDDNNINKVDSCQLVLITWEDSRQPLARWSYLSDLPDIQPVRCTTVGWLLKDGTDAKVVAQSMGDIDSDDMQAGGVMVIPARCVLSIDKLEEAGRLTSSCSAAE